jgi:hypothetical protein
MRFNTILATVFFFLYSCSASTTNFSRIDTKEYASSIKKVMVLHLGNDFENRKVIEDELTFWINHYQHNAFPSHRFFDDKSLPGKLELARIFTEQNFDGIVITQVDDIEIKDRFANTQNRYNTSPNEPVFYNYIDSYKNKYSTGYTFQEKSYVVNTRIYTTSDPDRWIYDSTTKTIETGSLDSAVEDFAKAISKNIHQNKILAIKEK